MAFACAARDCCSCPPSVVQPLDASSFLDFHDKSFQTVAKVTAASRGPESRSARSRKAWLRVLRTSIGSAPAVSLNIARRLLMTLRTLCTRSAVSPTWLITCSMSCSRFSEMRCSPFRRSSLRFRRRLVKASSNRSSAHLALQGMAFAGDLPGFPGFDQ